MAGIESIGKNTYVTNQNYNGVKIDIHNPVVSVPPQNTTPQQVTPVKIYKYEETQIPAEYFPTMIKSKKKPSQTVTNLPEPKPAVELPASVLNKKTVSVPEPVFIEEPKTEDTQVVFEEEKNEDAASCPTPAQDENSDTAAVQSEETSSINVEQQLETPVQKIADPDETEERQVSKIEIVPPGDSLPVVDYIRIAENLDSQNYDIQALQLKEIVDAIADKSPKEARAYIVEPMFHNIIDIVNKDTSTLAGPTDAQEQIRAQIMENFVAYEQQKQANVSDDKIVLPHMISEEDNNYANQLSPLELAERNKGYAIATLALLTDKFLKRVQDESGMIVPITDVPGLSAIVNALNSSNYTIRLNALDALIFLQRGDFAKVLAPIYEALANTDPDETVRMAAQYALDNLNAKNLQDEIQQQQAA